jgi:hypothetical protein
MKFLRVLDDMSKNDYFSLFFEVANTHSTTRRKILYKKKVTRKKNSTRFSSKKSKKKNIKLFIHIILNTRCMLFHEEIHSY